MYNRASNLFSGSNRLSTPPLPAPLFINEYQLKANNKNLYPGCYLVNIVFYDNPYTSYDGTIRLEQQRSVVTISGDLYKREVISFPAPDESLLFQPPSLPQQADNHNVQAGMEAPRQLNILTTYLPAPNPSNGITIFPIKNYSYYLRALQLSDWSSNNESIETCFELYRYLKEDKCWEYENQYTTKLSCMPSPYGYPSMGDYMTGDIMNKSNMVVGRISMGWISKYLRKATIQINHAKASEVPSDNGNGSDWYSVFKEVNWDINVKIEECPELNKKQINDAWSQNDLQNVLNSLTQNGNHDAEWRYHILAVPLIKEPDDNEGVRGVMFDYGYLDTNHKPREGIGVSSHWKVNQPGQYNNMPQGKVSGLYFRSAVHEIGHAMGLQHNLVDNGFMNVTETILSIKPANIDPDDFIKWSFASDDLKRLRHMPDIYVRPGGLPLGTAYPLLPNHPTAEIDMCNLCQLTITPLQEVLPLGAPVRLNITLKNISKQTLRIPGNLGDSEKYISGTVISHGNNINNFSTLLKCEEYSGNHINHLENTIKPDEEINKSIVLLHNFDGALFPMPGVYKISVDLRWRVAVVDAFITAETNIIVTSPNEAEHSKAALKVITTPEIQLILERGTNNTNNKKGIDAFNIAKNNHILRPYYLAPMLHHALCNRNSYVQESLQIIIDDLCKDMPAPMCEHEIVNIRKAIEKASKIEVNMKKIIHNKLSEIMDFYKSKAMYSDEHLHAGQAR